MAKERKIDKVPVRTSFPITIQNNYNTGTIDIADLKAAKESFKSVFFPVRKHLYDIYEIIVEDPHVESVIPKRIRAIKNISWACMHNGKRVEILDDIVNKLYFRELLKFIMESEFYGHSLIEIDFRAKKCELVPRGHVIPQFKVVVTDPNIINVGIPYDAPPYTKTVLDIGNPDNLGIIYKIAPYVMLKKGDVGDWATFCEVFGMPLKKGMYDPNIPGNEAQMNKALSEMGANSWINIPVGSQLEFVQAVTGSTTSGVHEPFANFCDSQVSKAVVGQTMTTDNGSSRSQSEVHMEIEADIHQDDRLFVASVLNEKVIPLLIAQGFAIPEGAAFQSMDEEETLTKKERLEMDLRLHKEVWPLPKKYFATEYNVEFDESAEPEEPVQPQDPSAKTKQPARKTPGKKPVSLSDLQPELRSRAFFDHIKDFFAQALR